MSPLSAYLLGCAVGAALVLWVADGARRPREDWPSTLEPTEP